ncbi:MAG: hypothetical protein KDA16_13590, partial [Phycisphaerales bacterium]|nr:hypothetical protein [Phycisphaerales bacterium]
IGPIRERRASLEGKDGDKRVIEIIREGTKRANTVAEETLSMAKDAMGLGFGTRDEMLPG